jgi:hypothetical protein
MGTNYYRIPTHEEVEKRKESLIWKIKNLPITPTDIKINFREYEETWDTYSPWDTFTKDICVHLGKRSSGWRFCWNFHHKKYYTSREELFAFIRSGRVVDEYGEEMSTDEFIEMALNWCPDGLIGNKEYHTNGKSLHWVPESMYDTEVDGLRVSSSSEFC